MIRAFFTLCLLLLFAVIGIERILLAVDALQTLLSDEYHHAHVLLDERHAQETPRPRP